MANWSRESRHLRGYGNAWDRIRLDVLRRDNGLCQCAGCLGGQIRTTMATEVHHIVPKARGGTDAMDNLQSVAHACHERLTALQMGREYVARPVIGLDGFPGRGGGG